MTTKIKAEIKRAHKNTQLYYLLLYYFWSDYVQSFKKEFHQNVPLLWILHGIVTVSPTLTFIFVPPGLMKTGGVRGLKYRSTVSTW